MCWRGRRESGAPCADHRLSLPAAANAASGLARAPPSERAPHQGSACLADEPTSRCADSAARALERPDIAPTAGLSRPSSLNLPPLPSRPSPCPPLPPSHQTRPSNPPLRPAPPTRPSTSSGGAQQAARAAAAARLQASSRADGREMSCAPFAANSLSGPRLTRPPHELMTTPDPVLPSMRLPSALS